MLERKLHLGLLGMLLDCEQQSNCQQMFFVKQSMSSSSSVQQEQLPSARSNFFLDYHKSSSSNSTTAWRGGGIRWTSRRLSLLLLHVFCVNPLFPFTHHQQQFSHYNTRGQREKLWREFFLDPSQCWDHRSEKVSEHQTVARVHMSVNEAIVLVGVNLVALSFLVAILPSSKLGRNYSFQVLSSTGERVVVVAWRRWVNAIC